MSKPKRSPSDRVEIILGCLEWAEVAAALVVYVRQMRNAKRSRRDACRALQEIDRVLSGADKPAPLDDLLSVGEGER